MTRLLTVLGEISENDRKRSRSVRIKEEEMRRKASLPFLPCFSWHPGIPNALITSCLTSPNSDPGLSQLSAFPDPTPSWANLKPRQSDSTAKLHISDSIRKKEGGCKSLRNQEEGSADWLENGGEGTRSLENWIPDTHRKLARWHPQALGY